MLGRLRPGSWLIAGLIAAAACSIAFAGWIGHSALAAPQESVAAYTVAPIQPQQPAGVVLLGPTPIPSAAPVPASQTPTMAYSVPRGFHGTFIPPVGGYVSQPFGPTDFTLEPALTFQGKTYPHFHTGIDIVTSSGTPVGASAAGVVAVIGRSNGQASGYGNYVLIEHRQGFATLYAHLSSVAVTVGEPVQQLQLIGFVGSTGLSTGPHLHFEIRHYGEYLDPLNYLLNSIRAW